MIRKRIRNFIGCEPKIQNVVRHLGKIMSVEAKLSNAFNENFNRGIEMATVGYQPSLLSIKRFHIGISQIILLRI